MICSKCKQPKSDNEYPSNYGKRNGSTCLECRRGKYKTRVEVARGKVHEMTPSRTLCQRCLALGLGKKSQPVKRGNRIFCDKHFVWASNLSDDFVGW